MGMEVNVPVTVAAYAVLVVVLEIVLQTMPTTMISLVTLLLATVVTLGANCKLSILWMAVGMPALVACMVPVLVIRTQTSRSMLKILVPSLVACGVAALTMHMEMPSSTAVTEIHLRMSQSVATYQVVFSQML